MSRIVKTFGWGKKIGGGIIGFTAYLNIKTSRKTEICLTTYINQWQIGFSWNPTSKRLYRDLPTIVISIYLLFLTISFHYYGEELVKHWESNQQEQGDK